MPENHLLPRSFFAMNQKQLLTWFLQSARVAKMVDAVRAIWGMKLQ